MTRNFRFLVAALCLCAVGNKAYGQIPRIWYCGAQGNNLIATQMDLGNNRYKLTITGSGDMEDYYAAGRWMGTSCLSSDIYYTVIIGDSVTSIGNCAFMVYCSYHIDTVIIGKSVTRIGDYAFYGNQYHLSSVTLPNTVTSIGNNAFAGCGELTSVNIPSGVTNIGDGAFGGCSITDSLIIPSGVTRIGNYTFSSYGFTGSLVIPNSITSIGNGAFEWCGFTSVSIPNSVTSIGNNAFNNCRSLNSITISNSVTSMGRSAFSMCSNLTSVIIGNSITSIEELTFSNCSLLNSVIIPNSVTTIEGWAFQECHGLTSVTIGNSVTTIGERAFLRCRGLTSITCKAKTPPILGINVFSFVPNNIPVYIPCGTTSAYRAAPQWNSFSNFIERPDTTDYTAVKCRNVGYTDQNFTTPIFSAGTYYRTFNLGGGCDSVVCLTLTEYPVIPVFSYSGSICEGGSYTDANFKNITLAGTHYDTLLNSNGCDSVICLTLSVSNVTLTNYWVSICAGAFYTDNHFTNLTDAGTYYDTLFSENGCDSVVQLTLSYYPSVPITNYSASICEGDSYTDNNFTNLTQSGTYYDTLQNINGCDSIVRLILTVSVGIVETPLMASLRVYPNPAGNQLIVEIAGQARNDVRLSRYKRDNVAWRAEN